MIRRTVLLIPCSTPVQAVLPLILAGTVHTIAMKARAEMDAGSLFSIL